MTETKKNPIGQFIENTLVPISTAFAQNRYVRCIGTGSQNLMAIIMIGAVFNLLNSISSNCAIYALCCLRIFEVSTFT